MKKLFYTLSTLFVLSLTTTIFTSCKDDEVILQTVELSKTEYNIGNDGGEVEMILLTYSPYQVDIEDTATWLSCPATKAASLDVATIIVEPNKTTQSRSGSIRFVTDDGSVTANITQAPADLQITEFEYFALFESANHNLKRDAIFNLEDSEGIISSDVVSNNMKLVASFKANECEVYVGDVLQESGVTINDFSKPLTYTIKGANGESKDYIVQANVISENIPHIYINVANGDEVLLKEYYDATVRIDGGDMYDDFEEVSTRIKGRGNSTWAMPKKPYKLKLDDKASVLGLDKAKDWVLLQNYIDPSMMLNAMAMKIGHILDVPYTNTMIPVDVTINGVYRGSYSLTQQIEMKSGRVDLSDDGFLLELDVYFDEDIQYKSPIYNLSVMLKDAEIETQAEFDAVVVPAFNEYEAAMADPNFPNNSYKDFVDIESAAVFLLANEIMLNTELQHPKSTYLHKDTNTKFIYGPIWDFDYTTGYNHPPSSTHFSSSSYTRIISGADRGHAIFRKLFLDPEFVALYKDKFNCFVANKDEFFRYMDHYAYIVGTSAARDAVLWGTRNGRSHTEEVKRMQAWFELRIDFLDKYINSL